jgi:hypothetical protein
VRYWHGLSPWYKVLAIDLALIAVVVALAFVFGTFWLWLIGLVLAVIAIVIGRLIGGGLGPGEPS